MATVLESYLVGNIWQQVYFGNALSEYVTALIILIGVAVIVKIIERVTVTHLQKLAEKTDTDIDDMLVSVGKSIKGWFFVVLGLYAGLRYL